MKKQEFIEFVKKMMEKLNIGPEQMDENVRKYWDNFSNVEEAEKPMFTENGKSVIGFMQTNKNTESWKAKDIAEGLFLTSRSVAGTMRKLITDGFVEKVGENPSLYALTEAGKNIEIQ